MTDTATQGTIIPFGFSFAPASQAVSLLARIANDPACAYAGQAKAAIEEWRTYLATPEQIAAVDVSETLAVDDEGACVSRSIQGVFVQTWTWIEADETAESKALDEIVDEALGHARDHGYRPGTDDVDMLETGVEAAAQKLAITLSETNFRRAVERMGARLHEIDG